MVSKHRHVRPAGEATIPRIHVASDILLYREGLASVLKQDGRLEVVSSSADVADACCSVEVDRIAVVLLDTGMEGAHDFARLMQARSRNPAVVALGLNETETDILPYIELGVSAYVCREGNIDDLVEAVFCTLNDELICSRQIAAALQRRITHLAITPAERIQAPLLTPREQQIADSLELGMSNKQIATSLNISVSTVKNHVHSVLDKLQVTTRLEAAARLRESRSPFSSSTADPDGSSTFA